MNQRPLMLLFCIVPLTVLTGVIVSPPSIPLLLFNFRPATLRDCNVHGKIKLTAPSAGIGLHGVNVMVAVVVAEVCVSERKTVGGTANSP